MYLRISEAVKLRLRVDPWRFVAGPSGLGRMSLSVISEPERTQRRRSSPQCGSLYGDLMLLSTILFRTSKATIAFKKFLHTNTILAINFERIGPLSSERVSDLARSCAEGSRRTKTFKHARAAIVDTSPHCAVRKCSLGPFGFDIAESI